MTLGPLAKLLNADKEALRRKILAGEIEATRLETNHRQYWIPEHEVKRLYALNSSKQKGETLRTTR